MTQQRVLGLLVESPDDWCIDIWFRGLKSGKVIRKAIALRPDANTSIGLYQIIQRWKIRDTSRIVDYKIRRRWQREMQDGTRTSNAGTIGTPIQVSIVDDESAA